MKRVSVCGLFFFFQAEDGIRDGTVTGVQTCALPIYKLLDWRDEQGNAKHEQARSDRNKEERIREYGEFPERCSKTLQRHGRKHRLYGKRGEHDGANLFFRKTS